MDNSDITLERVKRAANALPRRHRQVLLMSRIDALTYPQIADQLGMRVKAVEWTLAEAMFLLMQSVEDQAGGYEPDLFERIRRSLFLQCWRVRRRFERRP